MLLINCVAQDEDNALHVDPRLPLREGSGDQEIQRVSDLAHSFL